MTCFGLLFGHDLFGKPLPPVPDHALVFLLLSEMIVHAGTERAEAVAVLRAGDSDEPGAGEIDIEIFDLGAPVRCKPDFGAETCGPARRGVRLRKSEGLAG